MAHDLKVTGAVPAIVCLIAFLFYTGITNINGIVIVLLTICAVAFRDVEIFHSYSK